jgi:hypothetical protein
MKVCYVFHSSEGVKEVIGDNTIPKEFLKKIKWVYEGKEYILDFSEPESPNRAKSRIIHRYLQNR